MAADCEEILKILVSTIKKLKIRNKKLEFSYFLLLIYNNDHLANMVKNKAATLKAIAALPGVGEARVKQYGEQFLKVLSEHSPETHEAAE